jgi:hypothetical protein
MTKAESPSISIARMASLCIPWHKDLRIHRELLGIAYSHRLHLSFPISPFSAVGIWFWAHISWLPTRANKFIACLMKWNCLSHAQVTYTLYTRQNDVMQNVRFDYVTTVKFQARKSTFPQSETGNRWSAEQWKEEHTQNGLWLKWTALRDCVPPLLAGN